MKLFISIFFSALLSLATNAGVYMPNSLILENNFKTEESSINNLFRIRVTVKFTGTPQRNKPECKKLGTSCLGADIIISLNPTEEPPRMANEVIFTNNNNSTLTLEVLHTPDMDDNFFIVDEDFNLSTDLRNALQIKQRYIPKGTYKINFIKNGIVSVTVPIK
ncbi:MAG: hypothetical protein R2850_12230 [Bacteroidia bacterium]